MRTLMKVSVERATHFLAHGCKAVALCVPLLSSACPVLPRGDGGETTTLPSRPINDAVLWMDQAASQECPGESRLPYAALNHLHLGRVWLVNNPCRSGTNLVYEVFENYSDHAGRGKFCAIGVVAGSGVTQLSASSKGYVRIETYEHLSASEGTVTRYELRPSGVVQLGKQRRVVQKPD